MSTNTLLGLGIATSGVPGAIQQGQDRGRRQNTEDEARQQNRTAFKQRKQQMDLQLQKQQKVAVPGGADDEQIKLALSQAKQANAQIAKRNTFDAFDAYREDGDTWHLNQAFKQPGLDTALNISSVDQLNFESPADMALLKAAGVDIDNTDDDLDMEALRKRFVRVTDKAGNQSIRDMMTIYGSSGYATHKRGQRRQELLEEAKISKARQQKTTRKPVATALVRDSSAVAAARDRIDIGEGTRADETLVEGWTERIAGNAPAQHDLAEKTTRSLVDKFGGEDEFWATDFSKPANFRKAYADVTRIERLERTKLTNRDKTALEDIRVLLAVAEPGSKLTAKETGVLDKTYDSVKKYLSDNAPGAAATSGYAAFRNSARHALYGAALTEAEIKAFNDAFGTLGEQLGPVLTKFKTALLQTQAKLQSLAQMQNPYSAHVRLGVDQQQIAVMIDSLQERVDYLNGYTDKTPAGLTREDHSVTPAQQTAPAGRTPLSEIFGS